MTPRYFALFAGLLFSGAAFLSAASYHVDSVAGNDANPGTLASPWKTFVNVNSRTFVPGDQILLKRGSNFTTGMQLQGDGTSASYIVVAPYGTGAKPRFTGTTVPAITLTNGSYWNISGVDVYNCQVGAAVTCDYTETGNVGLRISDIYGESTLSAGVKTVRVGCSTDGTANSSLWMIKDVEIQGVTAINQALVSLSGVAPANVFTVVRPWNMQDFVIRNCYGTNSSNTTAIAITSSRNVTFQDNVLFDNMSVYAPQGTTSAFIAGTENVRIYNCYIAGTKDTNSFDMSGTDSEAFNDGLLVRGCAYEDNAGTGVEFLALTGRPGDYNRNQRVESCVFNGNGFDTNMGYDADVYFSNQSGLSTANYSGTVQNNIFNNPVGFTQGTSGAGWTITNNSAVLGTNLGVASADFSAVQGPVWHYTSFNGSTWQNLAYDTANSRWGNTTDGIVSQFVMLPGSNAAYWTAREWRAPIAGTVHIRGWVLKANTDSSGDGVRVRITKNGVKIWPAASYQSIGATDRTGVATNVDGVAVAVGDQIRFEINYGAANNSFDWTSWTPSIGYIGAAGAAVSRWMFDEASGTLADDANGANNGTLTGGAVFATGGRAGNAVTLDGVNDFVSVADAANLESMGQLTLSVWVRLGAFPGTGFNYIPMSKENAYRLTISPGGTCAFAIGTTGTAWYAAGSVASASGAITATNTWYHVAAVYDGTSTRIYVNGVAGGTVGAASGTVSVNTNALRFGHASASNIAWLNGRVDEARVYNRALTATEVAALYNNPTLVP